MLRLTASLTPLILFTGCESLTQKLSDPVIAESTANIGHNLQKIGDATGFPYAGAGLAAFGMVVYLLFGAPKKGKTNG